MTYMARRGVDNRVVLLSGVAEHAMCVSLTAGFTATDVSRTGGSTVGSGELHVQEQGVAAALLASPWAQYLSVNMIVRAFAGLLATKPRLPHSWN